MSGCTLIFYVTLLFLFLRSCHQLNLPKFTTFPESTDASTLKCIVKSMKLGIASYRVITEDGYILNLNRILNRRLKWNRDKGHPVLMVNGLFMHADSWVLHSKPHHNPAIAFLKAGYDVWLGDQRGTMRSRGHRNTTEDHVVFWDFTFHETGIYDLPAFIDFILRKTVYKKLVYVGNSLGTTFSYVLLSERPEYNKKMTLVMSMMPVGIQPLIETRTHGLQLFYIFLKVMMIYYQKIGAGSIKDIRLLREQLKIFCLNTPNLFLWQYEMTAGPGIHPDFEASRFCYQASLQCGGTSAKTILHVLQLFESGKFSKYNYGEEENMKRYNQTIPPTYNLRRVKARVAAIYSNTDSYSPSETVTKLLDEFKSPVYRCEVKSTHHVDALFGTQFHLFVPDMVQVLNSATGRRNKSKFSSGSCPPYTVTWELNTESNKV